MRKKFMVLALSGLLLAGCDTLGESALFGAGVGAVGAAAVGGNPATGAAVGAVGGAYCHQTNNIC
ncbi:MAG: hypothetical protein WD046_07010 [Paracoccaceae bacterium]